MSCHRVAPSSTPACRSHDQLAAPDKSWASQWTCGSSTRSSHDKLGPWASQWTDSSPTCGSSTCDTSHHQHAAPYTTKPNMTHATLMWKYILFCINIGRHPSPYQKMSGQQGSRSVGTQSSGFGSLRPTADAPSGFGSSSGGRRDAWTSTRNPPAACWGNNDRASVRESRMKK